MNPGPLAPEARIIPLDQAANETEIMGKKAYDNGAGLAPLGTEDQTAEND